MGLLDPTPPPYDALEWTRKPFPEKARLVCESWALQGYGSPPTVLLVYGLKVLFYLWAWAAFVGFTPGLEGGLPRWGAGGQNPSPSRSSSSGRSSSRSWASAAAAVRSRATTCRPSAASSTSSARARRSSRSSKARRWWEGRGARSSTSPSTPRSWWRWRAPSCLPRSPSSSFSTRRRAGAGPRSTRQDPLPRRPSRTLLGGGRGLRSAFATGAPWLPGAKAVQAALWFFAGVSKLNHHFPAVVCVMTSNSPCHCRRRVAAPTACTGAYPDDLRPSRLRRAWTAHAGTALELARSRWSCCWAGGGLGTTVVMALP